MRIVARPSRTHGRQPARRIVNGPQQNGSNNNTSIVISWCACRQVLDPSDESTLWTSPYGEVKEQWITFDLGGDYPVGAVRLLAMANTTGPKQVRMRTA